MAGVGAVVVAVVVIGTTAKVAVVTEWSQTPKRTKDPHLQKGKKKKEKIVEEEKKKKKKKIDEKEGNVEVAVRTMVD